MRAVLPSWILWSALAAGPALADIEGFVATPEGTPIEGATVVHLESGVHRATDGRGHFLLPGVMPPATLRVEAPAFEPLETTLAAAPDEPLALTLVPKRQAYAEEIVVTARRGEGEALEPVSVAAIAVSPAETATPSTSVAELAAAAPGVAESGQGGRFQAYSIRGVAGQRVFTTVAGMRIVTERRAGATASFIDPSLIGSVEVVRGPASTYYGSGALGGVVQALPRTIEGSEVEVGYGAQGDERSAHAGWGGEGWTLALAGRRAGDGETPDEVTLPSHYEQWSALLRKTWELPSGRSVEVLALPAVGRDIGKPNARFPDRVTQYPEEDHLLVKLATRGPGGWRLEAFVHPNELVTENLRATTRNVVDNDAFDLGLNAQREIAFGESWTGLVGLDYFGRRDVVASERAQDFVADTEENFRTLDGWEDEASLYGGVRRPLGRATVEAGARFTGLEQGNRGAGSTSDTALAGFLGATVPLPGGFELAANLGSGLRFPSLTERFFSGSTGAGEVVATEALEPERSLAADLGLRYYGERLFLEVFVFRNEIDDYIEQVELGPDVQTFVNLTSGTIEGLDLDGSWAAGERWLLRWAGTRIEGESDAGAPLAEMPAARASLAASFHDGAWEAAARLEHRFEKDDPGPAEQPTPAAELLSASVSYRLERGVTFRLFGTNLLDETYLPSADELAVPALGRSVGLSVRWARD